MAFSSTITLTGGFTHTSSDGSLTATRRLGQTGNPSGEFSVEDGDATYQIFTDDFSIAAAGTQAYDLYAGSGGELDSLNTALAMRAVVEVYIELDTPTSGQVIRFGPQGYSNAAQLWFQAATTNFWVEVKDKLWHADVTEGWTLGATTKNIALYNAGPDTITGKIWVVGRTSV